MDPFFRIELLPARQGDAIWVEYGKEGTTRRMMIDAGPIEAFSEVDKKLDTLEEGDKRVELVVITHVDTDHIEGIIRMFAEKLNDWKIAPEDIWFNGYRHMTEASILGGREGDYLSALLHHRAFDNWNQKFGNEPIIVTANDPLPERILEDGMKITILSPTPAKLGTMAKKWEATANVDGLIPGDLEQAWEELLDDTKLHPDDGILGGPGEIDRKLLEQLGTDSSAANGSCIAFLAEFEGKSCLFLGDAHASVLAKSIMRLVPPGKKRLKVDAVKVSHHGSRNNISKSLMEVIDARHFLFSTDGSQHNHPDHPAIETIIRGSLRKPVIWFNYRSKKTLYWKTSPKAGLRPYTAHYPNNAGGGIMLDLFKV